MIKLLEAAIEEHKNLLKEAGLNDSCWDSYENSSIIQLFHQVNVRLEKPPQWFCDYSCEPFYVSRNRKYIVRKPEELMWSRHEDGYGGVPKSGEVVKFVRFIGTPEGIQAILVDYTGCFYKLELSEFHEESALSEFTEENFTMVQREAPE